MWLCLRVGLGVDLHLRLGVEGQRTHPAPGTGARGRDSVTWGRALLSINPNWTGSSTLSERMFSCYVALGRFHPGHCAWLQVLQSQGDKLKLGTGRRNQTIPCSQTSKGLRRIKEVNLLDLQGRQGSTSEIFQQQSEGDRIIIPRQKITFCSSMIYFSQKKVGIPGNPRLRFIFIIKINSMYCKVCKSSFDQIHLTLLPFLEKTHEYLKHKMLTLTTVLLS